MKAKNVLWLITVFTVFLFAFTNEPMQQLTIKGRVTDVTDGSPIIGCNVMIKGTSIGVVTDQHGRYSISVQKGKKLEFTYVGYDSKEIKVMSESLNVEMYPSTEMLQECVVIGYSIPKKSMITGSSLIARNRSSLPSGNAYQINYDQSNSEEYDGVLENRFKWAVEEPLSTFSVDVDAASYSNMRRYINQGQMPPSDAIRTEELVNYFTYNYPQPKGSDPVSISTEVGKCPWNEKHRLVRIGIKAKEIADDKLPAANLVFLIDVSGSMYGATRLELVKSSLKLLINNLREKDRVAIVVYSGSAGEILPSTTGSDKQKIREALDQLTAGGSTAGGEGIKLAYKIARNNFIKDGNNRIILCTDGDFNVGVSSKEGLEKLIEQERKSGVFLTILGYGMGNYKDNRMQVLAQKGNGNHAYIDNLQEANKVLVSEFGGTMYTVAKDVKLQVEFNPAKVNGYRLIGYESRLLNKEDFNDDTKDAGEMGAGHVVTAFYEVIPVGVKSSFMGSVDPLKYRKRNKKTADDYINSPELLTVKLRYKQPNGHVSKKNEIPVIDNMSDHTSGDFNFAASVAMFGQLLRNSEFKGNADYDKVITLAKAGLNDDFSGYRREFIRLVQTVKGLN